jgi:hypothetical protein
MLCFQWEPVEIEVKVFFLVYPLSHICCFHPTKNLVREERNFTPKTPMSFLVGPSQSVIFDKSFLLLGGAELSLNKFDMENLNVVSIFLGIGVILSVTIFCAGQVYERSTLVERIHKLDLEKLKQKTEAKLELLWNLYRDRDENMRLPEGLSFKDIVDHAFIMNETLEEQILGLNQIHLDLICNGTSSRYFVDILDTYGHIVGM